MRAILFVSAVLITGLLPACVQPPDYPDEPVIAFLRLSKPSMLQSTLGNDSIVVTFGFTDGDGDLGFRDNSESIFIVDGRDSFIKPSYRIPYIEQQGAGNGISGEISIVIPTTCCIYPPSTGIPPCETGALAPQVFDTVFYLISIQDRAGNRSNTIQTAPIGLRCRF
jgi:hypothetical protein